MIPFLPFKTTIFRVFLVAVCLLTLLAAAAYFFPQPFLCVDSGPVKADVIIVLGGGLHERPERAAELFKAGVAPRIIVTGLGDDEIHRRQLIAAGVPAQLIEVEPNSRTTEENAEFTIRLLRAEKIHSAILVTSWYHSRRALRCFEHYAPDLKFYSRPSYFASARADWEQKKLSKRIYLEYLKLPGYWVRYGVWPF
jgi:uncharacterized SAM-binding protein YcdF (DUF218 family)